MGDEPDELLFYDEAEGEDQEYADQESHHGENNQQALYDDAEQYPPDDADEAYPDADADGDVDYEDPEEPAAVDALATLPESPVMVAKPIAPLRSWSSLSSKRSFDDSENLDQKGDIVTL